MKRYLITYQYKDAQIGGITTNTFEFETDMKMDYLDDFNVCCQSSMKKRGIEVDENFKPVILFFAQIG